MTKWNALVIEDEAPIRQFMRTTLHSEGWRVFEADSVRSGEAAIVEIAPDLILLDLGLPDGDGVHLVERLRKKASTPVIVLSARIREEDKVKALDAGADDYLTKPFGLQELLARIRVVQRRLTREAQSRQPTSFSFGSIEVDPQKRMVLKGGQPARLTPIEYRMLLALIEIPGKVLTHRELLRRVWGPAHHEQLYLVRIHMSHLRGKLEDDPSRPRHLVTEAGVGYRLVE